MAKIQRMPGEHGGSTIEGHTHRTGYDGHSNGKSRQSGLIRISRSGERAFFFYATVGMVILWGVMRICGG